MISIWYRFSYHSMVLSWNDRSGTIYIKNAFMFLKYRLHRSRVTTLSFPPENATMTESVTFAIAFIGSYRTVDIYTPLRKRPQTSVYGLMVSYCCFDQRPLPPELALLPLLVPVPSLLSSLAPRRAPRRFRYALAVLIRLFMHFTSFPTRRKYNLPLSIIPFSSTLYTYFAHRYFNIDFYMFAVYNMRIFTHRRNALCIMDATKKTRTPRQDHT